MAGGDDEPDRSVTIHTGNTIPTSPVMADGNVYIGPIRRAVNEGKANGPRANAQRPRTITVSWREIF
jgi:hypothetical protein